MGALVSFDEQYPIHRKVAGLSDAAFRLHTSAIFWCFRNTTDGFIPAEDLALVCPGMRNPEKAVPECERRGCWHPARESCGIGHCPPPRDEDGWIVHDYLGYQPSKSEATATRAGKSDGGSLGNHRRWHAGKGVVKAGCEFCAESATTSVADSHDRSHMRSGDRRETDRHTESGPNPTRADLSLSLSLSDPSSVVDQLQEGSAQASDDDPILRVIIDSIYEQTGRVVTSDHARLVAASVLGGRKPRNPAAYLRRAITAEANPAQRFLPMTVQESRPPWCGDPGCNEQTRMRENPDLNGAPYRCPDCGTQPSAPLTALPGAGKGGPRERPRAEDALVPFLAHSAAAASSAAPCQPANGATAQPHREETA